MVPLKRRTELALAAGVWVAAVGFATTLVYLLDRPLGERFSFTDMTPAAAAAVAPAQEDVAPAIDTTLTIPTVTIVARAPHRHAVPMILPESYPDIGKMNCAEWRELDMGSGHV